MTCKVYTARSRASYRDAVLVVVGYLLCVAAVFMVGGCSVDYGDADLLQELSESTPELVIVEPEYVFIRNRARVLRVSARNTEFFSASSMQTFTDVAFIESDNENNILNTGAANNAVYFIDSGNFELVGDVVFQSVEQNATVNAAYLLWDHAEQKLFGREDETVVVTRASGTRITGRNLTADLSSRIIEFNNASGTIFPDDLSTNNGGAVRLATGVGQ